VALSCIAPRRRQARHAARKVAQSYDADDDVISAILLRVGEAVTNAVVHAYRDQPDPGDVELEIHRSDGYLCVYVRDSGSGIRPRTDSPGAGFGLALITRLASELAIRSGSESSPGTELAMRFKLAG
jgi:anti-sigma regulatory factor (Ser/Thr protein kinase)